MDVLSISRVPLDALHLDPANARQHGERNLDAIRASLASFGQVDPLVVHRPTQRVIGGNGRLAAMRALGRTHADVVELDLTETQATALGIALNRTAELAEWDDQALARLLSGLQADRALDGVGFDADELKEVLASLVTPDPVEPPAVTTTHRGDVWLLDNGMRIYDIASSPTAPPLLGSYAPFGTVYHNGGVAIGNYVYVADGFSGATVYEVSNPSTQTFVSKPSNGIAFDTALLGNVLVAIAPTGSYIRTHDVSTPITNPLPVLDTETYSNLSLDVDAATEGTSRFAYITNNTQGCRVCSLDPPTAMTRDEVISPGVSVFGVTYHRGYLFLSEGPNGFEIWQR